MAGVLAHESIHESWAGSRGVLAKNDVVTPRASDDVSRFRLSLRDGLALLVGCAAMYGAQVARDSGLRSDIRNLQTSFEAAVSAQQRTNESLQQQINEWRSYSKLAYEKASEASNQNSRIEGILLGSGVIKERVK